MYFWLLLWFCKHYHRRHRPDVIVVFDGRGTAVWGSPTVLCFVAVIGNVIDDRETAVWGSPIVVLSDRKVNVVVEKLKLLWLSQR